MQIIAVNLGQPRRLDVSGKPDETGIFKEPAAGRVWVGRLGLAGDHVMDTKSHGGPDQALYLYSDQDYDWWAEALGEKPAPGTFGENLTLSGFGSETVRVGDQFRIGGVWLEVTAPRIPCDTFAAKMGDTGWVKKFRAARRPGLYVRVLAEGEVGAGDPVEYLPAASSNVTVVEAFDAWFAKQPEPAFLQRALASPIAARSRKEYERELARIG